MNYSEIIKTCDTSFPDQRLVEISVIIPVFKRTEFNKFVTSCFTKAIKYIEQNYIIHVSLTFVEHSRNPEHKSLCDDTLVNYIHIPMLGDDLFNKCLCFNIGALYSNKANFYLFHDSDTIVPRDFFEKLLKNIEGYAAVQSFTRQRLNYCNFELTQKLLRSEVLFENLPLHNLSYSTDNTGTTKAQGGSMFVKDWLFFDVGGFDCRFTQYSVEDAIFFDKLNTLGNLGFSDSPAIELYHLYHEPSSWGRVTKDIDWRYYNEYMAFSKEQKLEFIKKESDYLKQFING